MELSEQKKLVDAFYTWYDTGLRGILADNRRRYRMEMLDRSERLERGLSALPSTKSASVADRFREHALMEYHENPDSISFSAREMGNPQKDALAKWLTEIFIYRSNNTFPFFSWHSASLLNAAVDGIEAALVWWRKESITTPIQKFYTRDGQEVPQQVFEQYSSIDPNAFTVEDSTTETVVRDTWWIDSLMPGRDVVWDMKQNILDVNLGQFAMVKQRKSLNDIENLQKSGLFDLAQEIDWSEYQTSGLDIRPDWGKTAGDVDKVDFGDHDLIEIWVFFWKEANEWLCQFSIKGEEELSSPKKVNDVFFAGRPVNRLPLVIGAFQQKLWEATGRGLPETIAPIEDEWQDHRNNLNDIAKAAAQGGRIRVAHDSDVDLNDVLNSRVFRADPGEVEFVQYNSGIMESLRATDPLQADMNELMPVGIEGRGKALAPKGTNNTLGATQMLQEASNSKLGVQLLTRNETFLKPLLYLIAELEFAFETDQTIARIASVKAGVQPPQAMGMIDFRQLDFPVDIQINAGLGTMPRGQKLTGLMQIYQVGQQMQIPLNNMAIFSQMVALGGYKPEQFINPNPPGPPPPQVEYKCNVDIPIQFLPPDAQMMLMQKMMNGQMNMNANIESKQLQKMLNEQQQNGGGMAAPSRSDMPMVDATGPEAEGMSQGGQQSPEGMM